MNDLCDDTIRLFAKRSNQAVMLITLFFALGGALIDVGLSFWGSRPAGHWGIMMIPLCFITIAPIHFLCRKVWSLEEKLQALESQIKRAEVREQRGIE